MPAIKLFSPNDDGEIDMALLCSEQGAQGAVIYLFPGEMSGPDGKRSADADSAQARDFEDHHLQLIQMGWRLAGVSAQEPGEQLKHIFTNAIDHTVLADPQLHLARKLGLPTYAGVPRRRYSRLALIAEQGCITHALCLSEAPERSARLVVAWLKERPASYGPPNIRLPM